MLVACNTYLRRFHIARIVCMLLLVFSCAFLTGCDEEEEKSSQGQEATALEKAAQSCWTCSLFELGFEASNSVSKKIIDSTATSAISLLAVGFLLWIAIHVLKLVSSMAESDYGDFWKKLAVQAFWVTLCAGLLKDLSNAADSSVIKMVMEPIFSGFVDFGMLVVAGLPGEGQVSCPTGNPESAMVCLISGLQAKLGVGIKIGMMGFKLAKLPFVPLIGVGVVVVTALMMLYFPILLLDCVFRYGLLLCMLPLFIAAYCFPVTRSLCGKGIKSLVEIGLAIVGMCIFVSLAATILDKYTKQYTPYLVEDAGFLASNTKLFETMMTGPGITGLIFVMCFLMAFGGVLLRLMAIFGGVGGIGSAAEGAMTGVRNLGKAAQSVGKFANNRRNRLKDKNAKKLIKAAQSGKNKPKDVKDAAGDLDKAKKKMENAKSPAERRKAEMEVQKAQQDLNAAKKLDAAKDRLESRGFLKQDGKGTLHETKAYHNLGKGGVRQELKDLSQDWGASSSDQADGRHDDEGNAMTDNKIDV